MTQVLALLAALGVAAWAALAPPSLALQLSAALLLLLFGLAQCRSGWRLTLLSPLFLLAGAALVFFSLLPAAMRPWAEPSIYWIYPARALAYYRLPAESLVIAFAMLCLAVQAALLPALKRRFAPQSPPWPPVPAAATLAFAAAFPAALAMAVAALGRWWPPAAGLAAMPGGRDLVDAAPTVATFALAYLLLTPPPARPSGRLVAALLAVTAAMLLKGEGKKVAFMILGLGLAWAARPSLRSTTLVKAGGIVAVLACLGAANTMGVPNQLLVKDANPLLFKARALFETKIWGRQLETALCLQGVIEARRASPATAPPYYFAAALVPRFLWPDKPSLSKGVEHSVAYCGNPPEMNHSASITLLGEPLAEAGPAGLTAALAVLLGGLALVAWFGLAGGPAGLAMLTAMLPLLIDFDQAFSMYLANAVKFGGMTMPLAWWVARLRRQPA